MSGYHGHGGNYGGPTKRPRYDGDGGHHRSVVSPPPKRSPYSGNYTSPQTNYEEPNGPNRILLFTVFNPLFPIDCSVIFNVCSQAKNSLLRIVIFRKNGVQAMVEFDSSKAAAFIMGSLQGRCIYDNCCTLKIEVSKQERLVVRSNSEDSWDYTTNSFNPMNDRRGILSSPHDYGHFRAGSSQESILPTPGGIPIPPRRKAYDRTTTVPRNRADHGPVCMVYGLRPESMNPDRLFNILCLYGNVERIKFLRSKEGCAMVQMSDPTGVDTVMNHVHNTVFFDKEMQIGHSKQVAIADVKDPFELPDGSPSFKDFKASASLFRFNNQNVTNYICCPSKSLYFFDPPSNLTVENIDKFFTECGSPKPVSVSIEPATSIVTIEFENVSKATEALVICNNVPYNIQGVESPFIVKLWFTVSQQSISSSKVESENTEKRH